MVHPIVHDPILLARKSTTAGAADLQTAQDLREMLEFYRAQCVGMAANMIGIHKRIIAFDCQGEILVMLNPELLSAQGEYEAEEGCLSLLGGPRKTKRYEKIKVRWQNLALQTRVRTFTGWTAQIIQHELDHCDGILI